ncbi:hypothetical protein UCRPC4_g00517 [Phaeomoniella chlamydospora]|uniref:Telomere replication protein EST3 n=1 Tax=Phaeomoniella chlamydospora TaxID=158046 RepID=A0A0G2HJR7_PHACM|nr:hypothetical protein UCRPC4_g00517 [Phaeomoniella chlamydospora]
MKSTAMAIISNWIQPLFEEIGTKLIGSHWDRSPIAVNAAPISLSKGPNTIYIRQEVRQLVQVSQCRRLRTVGVLATVADSTSLIDAELRDPTLLTREESYGAHIPSIEAGNVIELHHIEIRITRGFKNWRTTLWMKGFDVVAHQGLPAPQPLLRLNNDRQFQELLQSYFRFFQKPVLAPAIAAMDSPGSIRSQESVPSPSLEDSDQENSNPYSISQMQFATQAPQTLDIMSPETTHNKSKRAHASSSLLSLLGDEPPRKRRRSNQGQSTDQAADKINYTSPVGAFQSKTRKFATYNQFGRLDGSSQKLNEAEVARKLSTATTHQILQAESEPEASRKPSTDRGRQNELPQHTICAANEQTRSQQPAADEDESNRTGTTSPFRGLYESGLLMNRFLPRRLFQIPGAQKRLLDRERSWQPPKVGDRSPNGCIPPRLLKRLADAADNADDTLSPQVNVDEVGTYGHASHARDKGRDCPEELPLPERPNAVESPHRTDLVIGVEPAYKESLSDESDTSSAVGSAEWPPSSPEEKIQNLPPDSSSEASPSGRRNKTPSSGERLLPEVGDRSHSKPVLRVFSQESEAAGHGRSSGGSSEPEQEGDASLASAGMKQTLFVHTRSANDVSYDHQTTSTPAVDFQSTNLSTSTQIQVKRTPVVHNNTMLSNTYPSTSDASPSEPFTRDSNYEPITHIPGTFGSPAKHWSADDNQSSHKLPKNNDPPVVPCGSETQTNDPGHAKGDMDLYVDRGDANSGDDDLEKAEDDALSQQLSSQIQEYSSHHAQAGQKLNSPHSNYTASQQYSPLQASHNGHVLSHEQLEIDECRNMRHRTRRHPTSESSVGDGVGHEQTPTPVETHIDYSSPQGSKQISKQATSARPPILEVKSQYYLF